MPCWMLIKNSTVTHGKLLKYEVYVYMRTLDLTQYCVRD